MAKGAKKALSDIIEHKPFVSADGAAFYDAVDFNW